MLAVEIFNEDYSGFIDANSQLDINGEVTPVVQAESSGGTPHNASACNQEVVEKQNE